MRARFAFVLVAVLALFATGSLTACSSPVGPASHTDTSAWTRPDGKPIVPCIWGDSMIENKSPACVPGPEWVGVTLGVVGPVNFQTIDSVRYSIMVTWKGAGFRLGTMYLVSTTGAEKEVPLNLVQWEADTPALVGFSPNNSYGFWEVWAAQNAPGAKTRVRASAYDRRFVSRSVTVEIKAAP